MASERADRIEAFSILVPAGTTEAAPLEQALSFLEAELLELELIIPDGHSGLTGFALEHSGQQVIPATDGAWIIGNDERIEWPLAGYPTGQHWRARAYNLDAHDHTFHLRLLLAELSRQERAGGRVVLPLEL